MDIQQIFNSLSNQLHSDAAARVVIVLIALLILLFIPVFISFLFPLFKSKLNHQTKVYLYAFSTGFFLILATFGFLREAIEQSSKGIEVLEDQGKELSEWSQYGYNIATVFGGVLGGIIFSFILKFVISYRINKKLMTNKKTSIFVHDHSSEGHLHSHSHPDHIFNQEDSIILAEEALSEKVSAKLKIVALALLLTHRIPEGMLIGYNLSLAIQGSANNLTVAYFVSLILHMIPEELVFYYRLRDSGYGRWNSLLISTLMDMLFLPFMLIGIFIGSWIDAHNFAQAALIAAIAGIFLFTSLVEFFPEFYHVDMEKRRWIITIISLFLGVVFSVLILTFHLHEHSEHEHTHQLITKVIEFSQTS
ncbi:ZIP family metal transporter [Mycoplasma sp. NEAQ87857]|uniref:ZIP family metal transporter n=1 Tax=Mycoplasma sp. NEAQ87857 TaxID=2683967 RepID=UPI001E3DBBF9|nr:ZIP family metal transporter [Mycoplasma sp. NEAQ87857]